MNGDLTKNFSSWEFSCKCCGMVNISLDLVTALQDLRNYIGCPIGINSGCRCERNNDKWDGHPKSLHLFHDKRKTRAADIKARGMAPIDLYWAAQEIGPFYHGGLGLYETFVHCDLGRKKRWGKVDGKYCSIEKALETYKNITGLL